MTHSFNPRMCEAETEAGRSLSFRDQAGLQIPGWPRLHRETLLQNKETGADHCSCVYGERWEVSQAVHTASLWFWPLVL